MTLHVRERWREAFLTLPEGQVIFLKQEDSDVREMITSQNSASHPTHGQPIQSTLRNTTVRKRVEEILRTQGKKLKLIPHRHRLPANRHP